MVALTRSASFPSDVVIICEDDGSTSFSELPFLATLTFLPPFFISPDLSSPMLLMSLPQPSRACIVPYSPLDVQVSQNTAARDCMVLSSLSSWSLPSSTRLWGVLIHPSSVNIHLAVLSLMNSSPSSELVRFFCTVGLVLAFMSSTWQYAICALLATLADVLLFCCGLPYAIVTHERSAVSSHSRLTDEVTALVSVSAYVL